MAFNSFRTNEKQKKVTEKSKLQTMRRLFSYMKDYRRQVTVVLLLMGYGIAVNIINPLLIQSAVDKDIGGHDMTGLTRIVCVALVLNGALFLTIRTRMTIMADVCNRILLTIRQELYSHIQEMDFHFFDSRPHGKILSRIIGDVNSLRDVLNNSVTSLIPDALTVAAVVVIMFAENPRLAAAALISTPFMALGTCAIEIKAHKHWMDFRQKSANLNAYVHEDLAGIRVIQSFAAEEETQETLDGLLKEHRDSFLQAVRLADGFGSVIDLAWSVGCICLYWYGIIVLAGEHISVGTFMAFSVYLNMFWQPINSISSFYNQLVTNIAGAERIFEIMDVEPGIRDRAGAGQLPPLQGEVEFRHVGFTYEDGGGENEQTAGEDGESAQVLHDVSFLVKPGETVALVGPTGAGKSTIVNLIAHFYEAQEGEILLDGEDIRNYTIESLHSQMAIMTQDSFLFSGTIRENIRYGKLDATDAEVEEAAAAVGADGFIRQMPQGYDTELTEWGGGLSGGQKQLIALARTMLSKPRILILDEATSSIDTRTELLVQAGIAKLLKGRTSFVIAHRLSTIRNADRIFVIDGGGIAEEGSAKELMAEKGLYYRMSMAQSIVQCGP
ncbi:MAG: ABC transporter ATP-binding protein/permease [Lachnospiraceae bacterium]|jgi:ATP-binding cassette subfamily B multidrug efflux pump|nr:ABC transporter ATP-binding protein/permease [Lachnospiraceae bacterium]